MNETSETLHILAWLTECLELVHTQPGAVVALIHLAQNVLSDGTGSDDNTHYQELCDVIGYVGESHTGVCERALELHRKAATAQNESGKHSRELCDAAGYFAPAQWSHKDALGYMSALRRGKQHYQELCNAIGYEGESHEDALQHAGALLTLPDKPAEVADTFASAQAPAVHEWRSWWRYKQYLDLWPLWECESGPGCYTPSEMPKEYRDQLWRAFRPNGMADNGVLPAEHMTEELHGQCEWLWHIPGSAGWAPSPGRLLSGEYRPVKWPDNASKSEWCNWYLHRTNFDKYPLWECKGAYLSLKTSSEMHNLPEQYRKPAQWRAFQPAGLEPCAGAMPAEHMTKELHGQCEWLWRPDGASLWQPATGCALRIGYYRPAKWPTTKWYEGTTC